MTNVTPPISVSHGFTPDQGRARTQDIAGRTPCAVRVTVRYYAPENALTKLAGRHPRTAVAPVIRARDREHSIDESADVARPERR